jgi:hypothetical protein
MEIQILSDTGDVLATMGGTDRDMMLNIVGVANDQIGKFRESWGRYPTLREMIGATTPDLDPNEANKTVGGYTLAED